MAKIDEFLAKILSSRYGKDVRGAIHDSIEEINNVNEANIATVQAIAEDAEASATSASTSAGTATTKANQASASATLAESWTVGGTGTRTGEDTNNAHYWEQQAKYWHDQAEQIAESLSGALRPMGTITFANLPSVSSATAGDMYNISDAFTTTSDFVEGAGIQVPLGSNVYMTTHQKWDVLAGSPVTGVKGNSESTYRRGNVNITKTDIGLGNVDNESLGTTDISNIGDGTVKGAISELNSDLNNKVNVRNSIMFRKVNAVTQASQTYAIQSGDINDYNTYTLSLTGDDTVLNSLIIDKTIFKSGGKYRCAYFDGTLFYNIDIQYVTDTVIRVNASQTAIDGNLGFEFIGMGTI